MTTGREGQDGLVGLDGREGPEGLPWRAGQAWQAGRVGLARRAGLAGLCLLAVVASSCKGQPPETPKPAVTPGAHIVVRSGLAMGSELTLMAWVTDEDSTNRAYDAVFAEFDRLRSEERRVGKECA